MKYFKRIWNKSDGELHEGWGSATFYFEVDESAFPIRQIEIYESGKVLKYDSNTLYDEHGGLGDQALDLEEFKEFEINQNEFHSAWQG